MRNTPSSEATKQLASTLSPYLRPGDVVVLSGDLGAGKTQFVQGVAAGLGVRGPVVSPTFNIMLSYLEGSLPLFHFDLYRLEETWQLEDVGYYDIVEAEGVSFIEWGNKFPDALPYGYLEIAFFIGSDGTRQIQAHSFGERARNLLCVWAHDSRSRLMKTTAGAYWKQ